MKKLSYILSLGLLCLSVNLNAQNLDDALRFNQRELTGTARSMGMANAFGALGGDLTSISINPAGIAVYRSSEFAFTPSFSFKRSNSTFGEFSNTDDAHSFPFNQIGGVATSQTLREKKEGVVSTHFGFTYNRTADFNYKMNSVIGTNIKDIYSNGNLTTANTLLNNILLDAQGLTPEDKNFNGRILYAWDNYLYDPLPSEESNYYSYYQEIDSETGEVYDRNTKGVDQRFLVDQSGYSGEYGFTMGVNISHVLLLGGSINFQTFNYEETLLFTEINTHGFSPSYTNDLEYFDSFMKLKQSGFGVNGKVGIIANLHPIRIGASFHSPTFYGIDEDYSEGISSIYQTSFENSQFDGTYSYNYRTPYRAQGSIAIVLGKMGLISIDYEMTDNKSSKISSKDRYEPEFESLNQEIKNQFKVSHDIKAGFEIKPVPYFSFRGGAAYFDTPYKDGMTYVKLDKWMFTGGIGFRNKNFFFDAAYAMTMYDESIWLNAYDMFYGVTDDIIELSNKRHQASFTFGWKF